MAAAAEVSTVINAMEDYANKRVKEALTKASHNACQQLLLENVEPKIAFEIHDSILNS